LVAARLQVLTLQSYLLFRVKKKNPRTKRGLSIKIIKLGVLLRQK
jgi:hypothetical protein